MSRETARGWVEDRPRMARLGGRQKSHRRTRRGPNAPRAFADPPSLHFFVKEAKGAGPRAAKRIHTQAGRVLGPQSGLGFAEVPPAPEDPSRSIRLRHPKTRPACASARRTPPAATPLGPRPHPRPPAADRREAANRPSSIRKRGVSPGLTLRRMGASDARRAKAQRTSERARAWRARSERPEGQPRAHPERPTKEGLEQTSSC